MFKLKLQFLLICFCLLASNILSAQKAKFKNKTVTVQKTRLPINFVAPENRTYDIYKKGAYSANVETREKGIFGWTQDTENPRLKGVISIYGFSIGSPQRSSQKKEKKDKDGKVTDRWTEYTYSGSAKGRGTLYIYGQHNPFQFQAKPKKKSKAQLKREAGEEARKKELEDNPFLSSEDVVEAEESDISEDSGLDGEVLQLVNTVGLDISKSVKTGTHRSASAAYADYTGNKRSQLYDFRNTYPDKVYSKAISRLNYLYGYTPVNNRIYLKNMKSDKHPEFKTWTNAVQATGTLFKAFKYNKSIDANQAKFDPIIEYFTGMVNKISDSDRKAKKLKASAFSNLSNILFYLDRHDEVISLCNKHLASKLLDKPSKRMLEKSERMKAHLAFHSVSTCHIESNFEIDEEDIETEEVVDEPIAGGAE